MANIFVQFPTLIVIIVSTRAVFLRKMTLFSQFLTKTGTRKTNGGRNFSEIKVQKTRSSNVRNQGSLFEINGNFVRYLGKTYCVRNVKK